MVYPGIGIGGHGDVPQAMLEEIKKELPYKKFTDYEFAINYMVKRSQSFNHIMNRKKLLCELVPIFKSHF